MGIMYRGGVSSKDQATATEWLEVALTEENKVNPLAPFMSENGDNVIMTTKGEDTNWRGDQIRINQIFDNVGPGVTGDVPAAEHSFQSIDFAGDSLWVNQSRLFYQAPNIGNISQQRVAFNFLEKVWVNARKQKRANNWISLMNQLGGYTANTIHVFGRPPIYMPPAFDPAAWAATPTMQLSSDSYNDYTGMNPISAPTTSRWIIKNHDKEADLTEADTLDISIAAQLTSIAETATDNAPAISPISGLPGVKFICFIHPTQKAQLKIDPTQGGWLDVTKFLQMGTGIDADNPIMSDIVGIYNGILFITSQNVPCGVNADGTPNRNVKRAIFVGAKAAMYASARADQQDTANVSVFVDPEDQMNNRTAVAISEVFGMKKITFNQAGLVGTYNSRPDWACMVISTWAPDHTIGNGWQMAAAPVQTALKGVRLDAQGRPANPTMMDVMAGHVETEAGKARAAEATRENLQGMSPREVRDRTEAAANGAGKINTPLNSTSARTPDLGGSGAADSKKVQQKEHK